MNKEKGQSLSQMSGTSAKASVLLTRNAKHSNSTIDTAISTIRALRSPSRTLIRITEQTAQYHSSTITTNAAWTTRRSARPPWKAHLTNVAAIVATGLGASLLTGVDMARRRTTGATSQTRTLSNTTPRCLTEYRTLTITNVKSMKAKVKKHIHYSSSSWMSQPTYWAKTNTQSSLTARHPPPIRTYWAVRANSQSNQRRTIATYRQRPSSMAPIMIRLHPGRCSGSIASALKSVGTSAGASLSSLNVIPRLRIDARWKSAFWLICRSPSMMRKWNQRST